MIQLFHQKYLFLAPDFVNSLEDEDHVYFFFREAAVEYINCGKVKIGWNICIMILKGYLPY